MDDLISRQAAIDAFNTNLNELVVGGEENAKTVENYLNRVLDKIKCLPSALGTDLAEVGMDRISRQAAIDGKICIQRSNGVEIYDDYVVPVEYLEQLPPAQPEPSQVVKDIARIVGNEQDMTVIGQERIRGRWIEKPHVHGVAYCSLCDYELHTNDTNFCPNCGAEMEETE